MANSFSKIDIKSYTLEQLEQLLLDMGQPKYRAKQIFSWIHLKKISSFDEMSNIPKNILQLFSEKYFIPSLTIRKKLVSKHDGTIKYLYELEDGNTIEAVYMKYHHGNSLCISSQVGCKMGCKFCASTIGGRVRNLTASEMLLEIEVAEKDTNSKINNVVLMGMGEPLDNFDNVIRFLQLLSHPDGHKMSLRNVTLSTCGLVDQIDRLGEFGFGLTLAVSLHAPTDTIRNKTMPINNKYPIEVLIDACKRYANKTGRRITYEYALIKGENDSVEDAKTLGKRLQGSLCHVNLIGINKVDGTGFEKADSGVMEAFLGTLKNYGVEATKRRTLGDDIDAACGQLRRAELNK